MVVRRGQPCARADILTSVLRNRDRHCAALDISIQQQIPRLLSDYRSHWCSKCGAGGNRHKLHVLLYLLLCHNLLDCQCGVEDIPILSLILKFLILLCNIQEWRCSAKDIFGRGCPLLQAIVFGRNKKVNDRYSNICYFLAFIKIRKANLRTSHPEGRSVTLWQNPKRTYCSWGHLCPNTDTPTSVMSWHSSRSTNCVKLRNPCPNADTPISVNSSLEARYYL